MERETGRLTSARAPFPDKCPFLFRLFALLCCRGEEGREEWCEGDGGWVGAGPGVCV